MQEDSYKVLLGVFLYMTRMHGQNIIFNEAHALLLLDNNFQRVVGDATRNLHEYFLNQVLWWSRYFS